MSTKAQAQRIINSERTFGQPVPFLLAPEQDGKFLLYDGHQRLSAWFTVYGAEHVMDAMVADRPLTEAEHKELIITLHTGATGSWNWETLGSWSAGDLQQWGMNADTLKAWNNDANNLKELLNAEAAEPVDAEPQIDRAAELAEKWHTATGQLWKLGEHRLLIGDCTVRENVERLMGGERADMTFIDPPYGVDYEGGAQNEKKREKLKGDESGDLYLPLLSLCKEYSNKSAPMYVWFAASVGKPVYDAVEAIGYKVRAMIIWNKLDAHYGAFMAQYMQKHEPCLYIVDGNANWIGASNEVTVWDLKQPSKNEFHPTQKPVELAIRAIGNHEAQTVIDLCGGSGTSIMACESLKRKARVGEISEKYAAVILERFHTATGITPELID